MGVSNPLTLVMNIKSPENYQQLKALLEGMQISENNPIRQALTAVGTVHFARFVFLNEQQLAVITTYDGSLETYIQDFADKIGHIFDALLQHMKDAPPLPVKDNPQKFLEYVKSHDIAPVGTFYSAYPNLGVQAILTLANDASS